MAKESIKKWGLGIVLVVLYAAFFIYQSINHVGVLWLVAVTKLWVWLFYKATGINLGNLGNKAEDHKD